MSIFSDLFKSKNAKVVVGDTNTEIKKAIAAINFPNFSFKIDDGKQISALITCSKILAEDIGRLPIKLFKTDESNDKTILRDDPRYTLLRSHPNSYLDSYTFWSTIEFNRSVEGNAYAKINRDSTGYPISFDIIENNKIGGIAVANGEMYYEYKRNSNESEIINSKDILHFRNLSTSGLKGRDPKDDLNLNLTIAYKASTVLDSFYTNGAIGTLSLESTLPDGLDPNEWVKQRDAFEEKYGGYTNSNHLFVPPIFTRLVPININFADAQLIETIKYNIGQVANYYKVPAHKVGLIENSKFNNLKETQEDYTTNTIGPILDMYRRELEFKLLSDDEIKNGISIEFETGALLITDSKTRIANYKEMFGMGSMSRERIAQLENEKLDPKQDYFIATGYMGINKAKGINPVTQDASKGQTSNVSLDTDVSTM